MTVFGRLKDWWLKGFRSLELVSGVAERQAGLLRYLAFSVELEIDPPAEQSD